MRTSRTPREAASRRISTLHAGMRNIAYFSQSRNAAATLWGRAPGLRGSPWTRSPSEESGTCPGDARPGGRARTRASAPQLAAGARKGKSMRHCALMRAASVLAPTLGGPSAKKRREESRRSTQECVRHDALIPNSLALNRSVTSPLIPLEQV